MKNIHNAVLFSLILSTLIFVTGCGQKEPYKIGFVGTLSGKFSGMGIEEKNAVLMAVEEINAEGGIKGRTIEVIYKDDENDPDTAARVISELAEEEIIAIIGHVTSGMTLSTYDQVQAMKTLQISPTTSTDLMSGKDDYFYRVVESSVNEAAFQATYLKNRMKVDTVTAVYDVGNEAYTLGWLNSLKEEFEQLGGRVIEVIPYDASKGDTHVQLADKLLERDPDCVVFALGAIDSALLCQQVRKLDKEVILTSSGWAKTKDFLNNGGAAVEGVFFSEMFSPDSQDELFLQFKENFMERFAFEPNFAGTHAYEAVMVLKEIFEKQEKDQTLKETADSLGSVRGLQGELVFDAYGDVDRNRQMVVVRDGRFAAIKD